MPKLVQIQYDMNCYDSNDSQTCLYLFGFNMIWIVMIQMILNISKLVQIQYDMNCKWIVTIHMILKHLYTCSESMRYKLIQFLNMSRLEKKTWRNTLKFSKWYTEVHWNEAIPLIAASKSSDQKESKPFPQKDLVLLLTPPIFQTFCWHW